MKPVLAACNPIEYPRGLIAPLQQIFLTSTTIKTPTSPHKISGLFEMADKFSGESFSPKGRDRGGTIVGTRKLIEATLARQSNYYYNTEITARQHVINHHGDTERGANVLRWGRR